MKDKNYRTNQYHEVRSFFRDSWAEVPDRTSSSRTMRPRVMVRQQKEMTGRNPAKGERTEGEKVEPLKENRNREENKNGEQEKTIKGESKREGGETEKVQNEAKPEKDRPKKKLPGFVAASAIYMPYFCFSTNCQTENNLDDKQKNYRSLLGAYKGSVIHESPTLDEWYYHFATDKKSTDDQDHRNETQVVTKFIERDTSISDDDSRTNPPRGDKHEPSQPGRWTLLRVNQVWIWTIEDKWLITATSCLLDDSHDALVEGILNELSKQAESGGSGSQPGSVAEMIRLIVDYCIQSYERKPKLEDQVSIGQTFSHFMNEIGRDEAALFEDFSRRTQNWQQQAQRNRKEKKTKGSSPDEGLPKVSSEGFSEAPHEMSPGDEIRNAIKKAEKLYCDIKDVRDELNILKSVAEYQSVVQTGLLGEQVKGTDLSAAYVVNDIKQMDIVADRIQSAVNTTLSLQQSEIANFQAALAAKQASLATDQGKILMAFTFATLLFLPLSFLSSLFAVDVDSFQQTPGWAFAVIFLVAVAVSIVLGFCAIYWDGIIPKLGKRVLNVGKKSNETVSSSPTDDSVGEAEKKGTEGGTDSRHKGLYSRFRGHTGKTQQGNAV